jgi:hypothetical protein
MSIIAEQTVPLLQPGQIWQLVDSNVHITMMGKTLVHFKHFRGSAKRANNQVISIREMKIFLTKSNAVLQKK